MATWSIGAYVYAVVLPLGPERSPLAVLPNLPVASYVPPVASCVPTVSNQNGEHSTFRNVSRIT